MILQRKLNFIHHLANLPEGSLAKEVFVIQKENSLRGLTEELKEHTNILGDPLGVPKQTWKKKIYQYTRNKNKEELIDLASSYKKLDHNSWKDEEFERKDFFDELDLESVRMMMKIKGGMVNTIRGNFKQKYRRKNQSITCQSCKEVRDEEHPESEKPIDSQLHVIEECEAFEDLRHEYDIHSNKGLVEFFKLVIKKKNSSKRGLTSPLVDFHPLGMMNEF